MQGLIFSVVFLLVYIYIALAHRRRGLIVWVGAAVAVIACQVIAGKAVDVASLFGNINYNVLMIFAGILLIAEVLIETGVPAHLAARLISISKSYGMAALMICALSSVISVAVENVATVMIVAPIALEVARKSRANPIPLMIGIAIASNLQGTATLIGDPPSMILAASENLGFNDFFFFRGKPGIFFAVQLGALASFFVLYRVMGRDKRSVAAPGVPPVSSWVPTILLIMVIVGLALISVFSSGVGTAAGLQCAAGGFLSVVWHAISRRKIWDIPALRLREAQDGPRDGTRRSRDILGAFDLDTLFLLAGIFFMVGALETYGVMERVGAFLAGISGDSPFAAFLLIVWGSVIVSAFVDNVPFVTAMIPVVRAVGASLGGESYLYLTFGLLVGSCLGGNISPVGASANIVSVAILRRNGHRVSFGEFVRIGLPFTIAATIAGSMFVWLIWRP